jgi:hypothetical protein
MERVHTLIGKLVELQENNAPASLLLTTAQLLVNELQQQDKEEMQPQQRVTIMLPRVAPAPLQAAAPANEIPQEEKIYFSLEEEAGADVPEPEAITQPEVVLEEPVETFIRESVDEQPAESTDLPEPGSENDQPVQVDISVEMPEEQVEEPVAVTQAPVYTVPKPPATIWNSSYEWVNDIPTLRTEPETPVATAEESQAREQQALELNDVIGGTVTQENLNEKLRVEKIELATSLSDAPVKDLKKAIGINERYQYINDLFRGDENMFDRSIKTINSFNIYPEAEFWIQRELKIKLGWPDGTHPTVQQFDNLIRRRFAH